MVDDLYQELIIDHSKRPRNFHVIDQPDREAEGYNPLCGDRLTLYLKLDGDVVRDASFVGCGCAISTASASLMTESLKGKTRHQALKLLDQFHDLLTTDTQASKDLGKLRVFCGVRDYPTRVKCATLAWHTLKQALNRPETPETSATTPDGKEVVTTE